MCLTGLDIEAKAQLSRQTFWARLPVRSRRDFAQVTHAPDPHRQAGPGDATRRRSRSGTSASRTPTRRRSGRAFSNAVIETGARARSRASSALGGGPGRGTALRRVRAGADPGGGGAAGGGAARRRRRARSLGDPARRRSTVDAARRSRARAAPERRRRARAPLGRVFGTRSGDKGGNANLGVFARSDAAWAWLDAFLDDGAPARAAARGGAARDRPPPAPRPALAQLRDPRPARGGRRRLDAPGSAGQGPRRVAARARRRAAARRCSRERSPQPRPARPRFPGVRAPKPLLAPEAEARLTPRQRELLDALEALVVRRRLRRSHHGADRGARELLPAHALRDLAEQGRAGAHRGRPPPAPDRPRRDRRR